MVLAGALFGASRLLGSTSPSALSPVLACSPSCPNLVAGLGTLLCALSTSLWTLLFARAITGAGGAGILTLSSIITTDLISLRERGYYQGLMMTLFGVGAAGGGPVAGWISDHYGWVSLFLSLS